MQFTTADGVSLHYLDQGSGTPVLLLHAFPLNAKSFRPQLEALSSKYRLIVPDQRGFGESGLGNGPTEMSTLARDGLALLDHLRIDSAVVGGVSMGGYASMALLRLDPARVKGLLLVDTRATEDDEPGKKRREETAKKVSEQGIGVLADSMVPQLLSAGASPELRKEVESIIRTNSPKGAAAALRGMALRPDSREILARYAGPALVVVGEQDTLTPPDAAIAMMKLMANASLLVLPRAGHLSHLEAWSEFNAAFDEFVTATRSVC
jgi:pimeloyl-ACP methyl ester carboxylesterase